MRQSIDRTTGDMFPAHDLAGERPAQPSAGAARLARMRERKNVLPFTVNIDAGVKREFDDYLARTGKSRNEVIERVLRTQVLRKR